MRMKNREPNATYWKKEKNSKQKEEKAEKESEGRRKSQLQINKIQQGKENIEKHKEKLQHW